MLAVAAAAAYLLVIGAIAVLGGPIRWATKSMRQRSARPVQSVQPAPTFQAPPSTDYALLVELDPNVHAEPARLTGGALSVFAAWVRSLPKGPRDPSSLVRGVHPMRRLLFRQDTWTEGRRFAWRSMPFEGRGRAGEPPVDVGQCHRGPAAQ